MLKRILVLSIAAVGLPTSAQQKSFRDFPPETQAQILDQLKPAFQEACDWMGNDHFDADLTELTSGDACLSEQTKDPAMVAYVREESNKRCLENTEATIRNSEGLNLSVSIDAEGYKSAVSQVVEQIAKVNCANR